MRATDFGFMALVTVVLAGILIIDVVWSMFRNGR